MLVKQGGLVAQRTTDLNPDPLFMAIGHVAFAWGVLEAYLADLLTALMHTPLARVLAIGQNYEVVRSHITGVIDVPEALEQHLPAVIPTAPASTWRRPISTHLCVLT
jgi:hypothetical protein